ncbi:MAG: PAS domain S-box protein [Thiohalocapsa sp.]|uniref:sensor domain-containing protein n=1 Tax=Thiohalocapsa sp. TaxID=2497641 RepID=UPI0025EA30E3|nr:PAS domain S-box protein [Thiohalocapsa sp.]MCG6940372.1 PAS domain S-box protein [Thiohalocapsa sp.]
MTTTETPDARQRAAEPEQQESAGGAAATALRTRALEALRAGHFDLVEQVLSDGKLDIPTLVENLRVYQAELELQNEELRASEQRALTALARYTTLFTELPMAGLVVDDYGLVLEANPRARDLLSLRDIRSHQYFLVRLVHEDDRAAVAAAFHRAKRSQAEALTEVRFTAADGDRFQADLHLARLPSDNDNAPERFVCAIVDQTEVIRQRNALARAYDELERSEERYRVLADFSPEWDYWYGPDRRFIYVSPACFEVTGYSAEAFRKEPDLFERIVHPEDLSTWQAHMDEAHDVDHHDLGRLQFRVRSHDGQVRWIEHVCRPVCTPDGRFLGRRGVNRDITKRHEAREALARSEALLNATGRLASVGGWELRTDTQALLWTRVTRELHEVDDDYVPTVRKTLAFYHPEDRPRLAQAIRTASQDGTPYALELRLTTAHGNERWVKTTGEAVRDDDGHVVALRGSVQDISARVAADHALRASEARFRSVFDAAPVGIAVVDGDERVVMSNAALQRFLGYDAAELRRMSFRDYTHPDEIGKESRLYADLLAGRRGSYTRDNRYLRKDGRTVWGRLTVALLRDPDEGGNFAISMVADIDEQRAAERARRESERRYRALYESAGEGMAILQGGVFTSFNAAAVRLLGYEDQVGLLGKQPAELSPERQPDGERSADKQARISAAADRGEVQRFDWELLGADDSVRLVQVTLIPAELEGERALFSIWYDLTEGRAAALREARAHTVFENTMEGIVVTDAERHIVAVNRAFTEITGYSEEEALGQDPRMLQSGRHDESFYQALWASLNRTGQWRGQFWNRRKNGEIYPQLSTISAVHDPGGRLMNYIGVFSDITQLKRSEQALYDLAHKDPLTGLANRTLLRARLEQSLPRAARAGRMLALLFLDLDLFKNVNDTLGHPVGDALLQSVADAMAEQVGGNNSIARLGGDEFVVLLEDIGHPDAAAHLARRLLGVFTQPFAAQGRELHITASIGISVFPADGEDMDALLANADVAMYRAKDQGRNTYRFFKPEMTEGAVERLKLENALRGALARSELTLEFQPQVRLADGCMHGAEALLRWHHPEYGQISPSRFIPIAEELGLIVEFGYWALEHACKQLAEWDAHGFLVPRLAVNLSVLQLERPGLVKEVQAIMARTHVEPDRLELEVTESMLMRHADQVIANLAGLRDLGITIAVDDFGSGFSSLAYLKRLPIHRLKIDKSFIDQLTQDANDDAITRAIIALGHGLGLEVIAEGVETEPQAEFLRREGCAEAQGFLFGKPMPAHQLIASAPFNRSPRPGRARY